MCFSLHNSGLIIKDKKAYMYNKLILLISHLLRKSSKCGIL